MSKDHESQSPVAGASAVRGLLALAASAVGGWIGYSALIIDHHKPLPPAIDAERKQFVSGKAGLLSYYADTSATGRPLVLLHSINAAASAYEMRPLFNAFRFNCPVYALDLPGFGFSERSDREYTPRLYADAILDFLNTQVGEAADVIALSLSSEFAAHAAQEQPFLFNTLTMISPSGFKERKGILSSQDEGKNGIKQLSYNLLSFPLWAQAFYDLLATQPIIQYYLKKSFVGPVDPALSGYAYLTSHQPGARNAPLYFVSGQLFTPNVRERVYESLHMPVLVIYDRDPYVRFDTLDDHMARHANWFSGRITPTLGLPQFERLPETIQALDDFWGAQDPLKPVDTRTLAGWSAEDSQ